MRGLGSASKGSPALRQAELDLDLGAFHERDSPCQTLSFERTECFLEWKLVS